MDKQGVSRRYHVTFWGERGPVLVLSHGLGCDQRLWRFVAADLARDHRVVLFDHVGSGRSDTRAWSAQRYAGLDAYASDVLNLLTALDLGPVHFVGHSISGSIGMLAAIAQPARFASLVLLSPNPCFVNQGDYNGGFEHADILGMLDLMERNMAVWANFMAPLALNPDGQPELIAEFNDTLCAGEPAILRHFARVVFLSDVRARLGEVNVPTLILQSANDHIAPQHIGAYMAQRMPHAVLRHMAATGHCPHFTHPQETAALIRAHLQSGPLP